MLFSIVVPIYNVENYLQECIDSIINQIIKFDIKAEILLMDDGSTDNSGKICDLNFEKYPKIIKVVHKKNEGLLCTRRKGFSLAEGEYIISCDSDDILADDTLFVLKNMIEKYHPDIMIFNMGIYDGKEKNIYYENCFTNASYSKITRQQVLDFYFMADIPVVTSMAGKAIKRTCFDINKDYSKFYNNSFGEDTLQSIEVFSKANDIFYINKVLYYYRMSTGMSAKFTEDYYMNFLKIIKYISEYEFIQSDNQYHQWFTVKMLKVLARSITQSKNKIGINYKERKIYLEKLYNEEKVSAILSELDLYKNRVGLKYWIMLLAFKYRLFFCIHVLLSI